MLERALDGPGNPAVKYRVTPITKKSLADSLLVISSGAGIFYPPALVGVLVAVLVRAELTAIRLRKHHGYIGLAVLWAFAAQIIRWTEGAPWGITMVHAFTWSVPLLLAVYKPDHITMRRFALLLALLFVGDFTFNLYAMMSGHDLLGRQLDARGGLLGVGRLGGLAGHSFYSGSISLAALLTWIGRAPGQWRKFPRLRAVMVLLAALNMLLAGSARLGLALLLFVFLAIAWKRRTMLVEAAIVITASVAVVLAVGSSTVAGTTEFADSNMLRAFAWTNAATKIAEAPWFGVGFSDQKAVAEFGVSRDTLEEHNIGESWYLNNALWFGIPYTVLMLLAYVSAFYFRYQTRDIQRAVLFPYVLIDFTYGAMMSNSLGHIWLWLLVSAGGAAVARTLPRVNSASGSARLALPTRQQTNLF